MPHDVLPIPPASHREPLVRAVTVTFGDLALIAALAFLTVVDLFAAQALLPSLAQIYGVMPSAMGLAVNACTLGMALGALGIALAGDRLPRRAGIAASLAILAVPTATLSFAPNLIVFGVLRIVQGFAMSAAFGLSLAHLADRFGAHGAPSAFAAYITGNVASNFLGRLMAATVADHAGVGAAFLGFAGLNGLGALLAWRFVTDEGSRTSTFHLAAGWRAIKAHVNDPRLRAGFAVGFCILFAFIGVFTYVNFVLVAPPLSIGMMELGIIYLVFVPAVLTTPLAGAVVVRLGAKVAAVAGLSIGLGALPLLLSTNVTVLLAGMTLFSMGTFFAQAVTTGAVSRAARDNKSAASGLYLASYFLGGLVGTAVVGMLFDAFGWETCIAAIANALGIATWLSVRHFDDGRTG